MAEEVPQDVAAAIIDRVASNQMGVDPTQAQAPKKEADEKPTETEKAVEEGSPKVESDAMDENPVLYKILMGKDADGNDEYRDLSPEQISATLKRYAALNHKNAEMKPVNMVIEAAIKNGLAKDPMDAARQLVNLMKAGDKNTELGETDGTTNVALKEQAQASGDMFAQYEEDNAISLLLVIVK